MSKGLKIALIVTGSVLGALLFTAAGFFIARGVISESNILKPTIGDGRLPNHQGMNGNRSQNPMPGFKNPGNGQISPRGFQPHTGEDNHGFSYNNPKNNVPSQSTPLTMDAAQKVVESYLTRLNNPDLKLAEIILFDNGAYARIVEKSTGIGAFELLVRPGSNRVISEMGPSMMWNLKYGGMRGLKGSSSTVSATMTVTSQDALQISQKYLDANIPGAKADTTANAFYGYYSIEYLNDGNIAGILSVNGTSGDVFPHTWQGKFLEVKQF